MTELTMADFRKVFPIAILLTIVQWVATSGGDLHAIVPTLAGFIAIFAAFFVVGLLFLFLQRQAPW
ncbi:hypothetical protein ACFFQF_09670 [Haladaptatus pallidirubidus]|uniref:Uncharacterized protein n=2 Tax=Haladaptatus pallidirubidus TaxID=1008152 RepID=A0AAV3UFC5_9EURY|nr:hypothetical protein [Haladaptatus pallidirubidus]